MFACFIHVSVFLYHAGPAGVVALPGPVYAGQGEGGADPGGRQGGDRHVHPRLGVVVYHPVVVVQLPNSSQSPVCFSPEDESWLLAEVLDSAHKLHGGAGPEDLLLAAQDGGPGLCHSEGD